MKAHARITSGRRSGRAGFTLIEVLVVVAIIALLLAILLPSLQRARQQARLMICLGHMKEFGNATAMYTLSHKERLPGPVHPALLKDLSKGGLPTEYYLPWLMRRYFSEGQRGSGSMTDQIASCPSFPVKDSAFEGSGLKPFHFAINTWTYTAPNYYFGFAHGGQAKSDDPSKADWEKWEKAYGKDGEKYRPKKSSVVKRPDAEWAIADAFQKPNTSLGDFSHLTGIGHGSWPREDYDGADSGIPLSKSPFHLGGGYRQESLPGGGGTVWKYDGRTSTLYFDGHAEGQRGFRGTVHPAP